MISLHMEHIFPDDVLHLMRQLAAVEGEVNVVLIVFIARQQGLEDTQAVARLVRPLQTRVADMSRFAALIMLTWNAQDSEDLSAAAGREQRARGILDT